MKRIILLSVLGVGTFLFFLISATPAAFVLNFLPERDDYSIQGVSGSLWDGRFERVRVSGLGFGPVEWQLRASRLLLARADADLTVGLGDGRINGRVIASHDGALRIPEVSGQQIALSRLAPLANHPPERISGEAGFQLQDIQVREGRPLAGRGELRVFDLGLNMMGRHELGTYTGQLEGSEGQFELGFGDVGEGPFELSGNVDFRVDDARYELEGRIRPRESAPDNLSGALRYLGDPNEEGFYQLETSGQLAPTPF